MRSVARSLAGLLLVAILAGGPALTLGAQPARGSDPPYSVPEQRLAAALRCPAGLDGEGRPVLLVHATFTYGAEQFGWNWGRVLPARGVDHCLVSYPDRGFGDQQTAAEYVAHAVRELHRRTGRPVDVVAHSQGGLVARWAVRFWPSVRAVVDDLVSLAVPHHGLGTLGTLRGTLRRQPASFWQFASDGAFLSALNRDDETPGAVDYTQLYSASDALVRAAGGRLTMALDAGRPGPRTANVLLQDVCPGRVVHHVAMGTTDRLAFALALDALSHPGPADPRRLDRAVCGPPRSIVARGLAGVWPRLAVGALARGVPDLHLTATEPPLRDYAR